MKKADREIVFNKYGGKCAYCGCGLTKGWHVDEFLPVMRYKKYRTDENGRNIYNQEKRKYESDNFITHPENFNLDNQMPACASCNILKGCSHIEHFRDTIKNFINSLNSYTNQYKIAKRYGLVEETNKPVIFYFETLTNLPQSR